MECHNLHHPQKAMPGRTWSSQNQQCPHNNDVRATIEENLTHSITFMLSGEAAYGKTRSAYAEANRWYMTYASPARIQHAQTLLDGC
jgi:hypothetical protein